MGSGFAKKKKQAKTLQQQLMQMQSKMADTEVTGTAGNGFVTLVLNGEHELKRIDIKRECVDPDDIEGLTLLIKAAYTDAITQLKKESMADLPPGLGGLGF